MNKLITLSLCTLMATGVTAQVTSTVSVGASYINQKWYSLENGEVGSQPKDNWDIAFEITGISSAILANTQKSNFALYQTPFKIDDYGTLDTVGISGWPVLYNSDTSWAVGAFNRGKSASNSFDLGWGVYDMNTHFVNGDSCFVLKLSASSYKKLKIVSLAGGVYTFEYADINGANSFTQTINKTAYPGRNFAYFDFSSNTAVDREPVSADWDLTFVRYTAFVNTPAPTAYPVVGIKHNKGVTVAQANNVTNPVSFTDWQSQSFNTNITTIGHDWKAIDIMANVWKIVNDTVYFVKDKAGEIWKVRPISFGGSANGDYVFSKQKLTTSPPVGIDEKGVILARVTVFPNPATNENVNLLFSSNTNLSDVNVVISDLTGKQVANQLIEVESGLNTYALETKELTSGLYFVTIQNGSNSVTQKLIIK